MVEDELVNALAGVSDNAFKIIVFFFKFGGATFRKERDMICQYHVKGVWL